MRRETRDDVRQQSQTNSSGNSVGRLPFAVSTVAIVQGNQQQQVQNSSNWFKTNCKKIHYYDHSFGLETCVFDTYLNVPLQESTWIAALSIHDIQ